MHDSAPLWLLLFLLDGGEGREPGGPPGHPDGRQESGGDLGGPPFRAASVPAAGCRSNPARAWGRIQRGHGLAFAADPGIAGSDPGRLGQARDPGHSTGELRRQHPPPKVPAEMAASPRNELETLPVSEIFRGGPHHGEEGHG
jgi:hypothetical protein